VRDDLARNDVVRFADQAHGRRGLRVIEGIGDLSQAIERAVEALVLLA
jgi:hypothetical protein